MPFRPSLVLLAVLTAPALADDDEAPPPPPPEPAAWQITFDMSYETLFETDIDGPGDGDVQHDIFRANLGLRRTLTPTTSLTLQGGYWLDDYDFGGANPLGLGGGDPWSDVHTWGGGVVLDVALDDGWAIYGGPLVMVSGEGSLDPGDAVTGGGLVGVRRTLGEHLTIGGGLGIMTELEDSDPRLFPTVVLNWEIDEHWRLTSRGVGLLRSGVELVWHTTDSAWEVALGAGYERRRFRLDDTAPVVDGVAEDSALPIWVRATFRPDHNVEFSVAAGFASGGEFVVENSRGGHVVTRDYDGAFFVGATVRFRF